MRWKNEINDKDQSLITLSDIWNDIFAELCRCILDVSDVNIVCVKEESGTAKKTLCSRKPSKLSHMVENNILWKTSFRKPVNDGDFTADQNSYAGMLLEGFFSVSEKTQFVVKDNDIRYGKMIAYIASDVPKCIRKESAFLQNVVEHSVAFWKWSVTAKADIKAFRIGVVEEISLEHCVASNCDTVLKPLILRFRERDPVYEMIPENWGNLYEMLAAIVLLTVVSMPLLTEGSAGKKIRNYDTVMEQQELIRKETAAYFETQKQKSLNSEGTLRIKHDFVKQEIDGWFKEWKSNVPGIERVHVAADKQFDNYRLEVYSVYVDAIVEKNDEEIERILSLLDELIGELPELQEKLKQLSELLQSECINEQMENVIFEGMNNAMGRVFSIGSIHRNDNDWRNE